MEGMIIFSRHMLQALAEFLASEPIIYLYGMIIFLFVAKVFKMIIGQD